MQFLLSLIATLVAFSIALVSSDVAGPRNGRTLRALALLIGSLAAIASIYQFASRFLIAIPAGNVGVVELFGHVEEEPLTPGLHAVNPFAEVVTFSTRMKDIKESVSVTSKEGLIFTMDVSLQYKLNPYKAGSVYENIGTEEEQILISRFRSAIRQIINNYESQAIYSRKQQEITQRLYQEMSQELYPLGFVTEEVLLKDIVLPKNLQAAIEQKLKAEQESELMEFELEKARQEGERNKIELQGIADIQKLLSRDMAEKVLELRSMETRQKLPASQNTNLIIIGADEDKLPLFLQQGLVEETEKPEERDITNRD
ncbi:MAG: prohibitin family protein [Cyanobacteriota bacterium]|nr:prohibitin family protein [Cyanobacteriota bacterium]